MKNIAVSTASDDYLLQALINENYMSLSNYNIDFYMLSMNVIYWFQRQWMLTYTILFQKQISCLLLILLILKHPPLILCFSFICVRVQTHNSPRPMEYNKSYFPFVILTAFRNFTQLKFDWYSLHRWF